MNALEALLNRPLDDFDWSVRTRQCLLNEGCQTVRDLVRRTEMQLIRMPNFGRKSLTEVKEWLAERQLRLGMDIPVSRVVRTSGRTCQHRVKMSATMTLTRFAHEDRARRLGVPVDQCVEKASHIIDGVALCRAHAGRRALEILEGVDHAG